MKSNASQGGQLSHKWELSINNTSMNGKLRDIYKIKVMMLNKIFIEKRQVVPIVAFIG